MFPDPPTIEINLPTNTSVLENNYLRLPCPSAGTPRPIITWYMNEVELTGNELGVHISLDGTLELDHIQADDAGLYKCVATNIAGNSTHVVDVKVYCK